ncbi:Cytochrome c551 peroxidase [hydrothermal vent metagenome]|uniref:Cytochrome c551 peroxidase n=1 Tax=hydrothermal vent metagenome TaxID=652676 RepID=A0A3B0V467_9ZZZZ
MVGFLVENMAKMGKWGAGIVIALLLGGVLFFTACRTSSQPVEPEPDAEPLVNVPFVYLQEPFPPLNVPEDNPTTPEKVALGRLLFFDSVLSENNDVACATCHQPSLGLSDGRSTSIGTSGIPVTRNAPTLWNVGYVQNLFWDGRIQSLEAQAVFPLTNPDEMGVRDLDALIAELLSYPEYVELFAAAFPDETIGLAQVEKALAAYQRTFISNNSPFDRFVAGEAGALTAAQQRGLDLFRSTKTRCVECHTFPTFSSESFRVIGVESDDLGRAAVFDGGLFGSFKVPTLRNVALTAPYMHNSSMTTLAEVVNFYADGGGRVRGVENMDGLVQPIDLSAEERAVLHDGSRLELRDYLFGDGSRKYAYQWMESNGTLRQRWDNAPHWSEIATKPHHTHLPNQEVPKPSTITNVEDLLGFLRKWFEQQA